MSTDSAIEQRAVLIRRERVTYDEWQAFTYDEVISEATSLGLRVLDLDRLQGMLLAYAARIKPHAHRLGPICKSCGYTAEHHPTCREPGLQLYDARGVLVDA